MKKKTDRAKTQNEREVEVTIPSRENFEHYFKEFHKMFQHCKYNLVALNKRFDVLEKFFKNEVGSGGGVNNPNTMTGNIKYGDLPSSQFNNYSIPANYKQNLYDDSEDYPDARNRRRGENDDEEENFPISIEDLEYLTKNYISESVSPQRKKESRANNNPSRNGVKDKNFNNYYNFNNSKNSKNSKSSSQKKKGNNSYDVIIIDKKKMRVEDNYNDDGLDDLLDLGDIDEHFGNSAKTENENEKTNDKKPDSFNQKLFDYKNYVNSSSQVSNNLTAKDETVLKSGNDDGKWLTKEKGGNNINTKSATKNIFLSNDNDLLNSISAAISLSMDNEVENKPNLIKDNICMSDSKENQKEKTKFADFIKMKKQILLTNPNIVQKPKEVAGNINKSKDCDFSVKEEDDEEVFYSLNKGNDKSESQMMLRKKRNFDSENTAKNQKYSDEENADFDEDNIKYIKDDHIYY